MTEPVPDIAVLFARDPEKMSDADIDAIIEHYRSKRHLFNSAPAGSKPAKLTEKEAKTKTDLSGLTLDLKL